MSKFFPEPGGPRNERTAVSVRWAEWQAKNGNRLSKRVGIFRKDGIELLVYEYGGTCGVLKRAPRKPPRNPEILDFRPWAQPFEAVSAKLKHRGWELQQELLLGASHEH